MQFSDGCLADMALWETETETALMGPIGSHLIMGICNHTLLSLGWLAMAEK